MTYLTNFLILSIAFVNLSCGFKLKNTADLNSSNSSQNSNTLIDNDSGNPTENKASVSSDDPIYSIDFKNFSFPVCPKSIKKIAPEIKSIQLKNGKLEIEKGQNKSNEYLGFMLSNVSYNDLTNDGKKDAVVTIGIKFFQGSVNCTFIYAKEQTNPKLLWTHEFGSDANGGIRKLAFENGGLLIEEYKTDHLQAVCCPKSFTRSLYIWDGKHFIVKNSEVLPTDIKHNLFLGYPPN